MRVHPRWTRPLSFEVQCWIAWSGLAAFGLSGLPAWRTVGAYPPLELGALVLAGCWAIDLARTGRALRRARPGGAPAGARERNDARA